MKRCVILGFIALAIIGFGFPRHTESNSTVNSGYGKLRLQGYAIMFPVLPTVKVGRWTAHYESGALGKEQVYFFGFPQRYREYHPDGVLKTKGLFRRGRAVGEWHTFHPDGRLATVTFYEGKQSWPVAQRIYSASGDLVFHTEGEKVLVDKLGMFQEEPNP